MAGLSKNGKSSPHCWVREVSTQFAQQFVSAVTAPPIVGCVVWSLGFLLITFFLHFFMSWTSSLSISSSAISASTFHIFLHTDMTISSQSTTSNDSCDKLNSNQFSQFLTCYSVFHTTHPSNQHMITHRALQHNPGQPTM